MNQNECADAKTCLGKVVRVEMDPARSYQVAINDFLLTGFEQNLDYLTFENESVQLLEETVDIRMALIEQLKQTFGDDER